MADRKELMKALSETLLRIWEEPLDNGTKPVHFSSEDAREAFRGSVSDLLERVYDLGRKDERKEEKRR